ncbi:hypothetical protein Trydic_g7653 [Trypoxylus dichotomus]
MVADTEHPTATVNEREGNASVEPDDIREALHKTIFDVVKTGEVSDVEELVEKSGVQVLRARDEWGYTPAHWVALDGNVEMMRYLVDKSAPVNLSCLGTQGPRPIHWACRKGHSAVVQVLLQAGVAVNAADFKGLTPLMTACMFGRTATAAFLLGMGALNNLVDINGDTALHWAAYKGHVDVMKLLMYSGADLQAPDYFGSTPLHLACISGSVTCVKLLCEKNNLDLEPLDKNDKTPLMLAQSHRHGDIVQVLQIEKKRKSSWFPSLSEVWGLLFGKAGNSKLPLLFFMVSVLLWGYPMYIVRCVPITWNILRGSHYCFIYWNIVMWVCWVVANRKNPGYIPMNTDSYSRAIKQIPYFDKWKKLLGWILTCSSVLHACMNLTTNEMFNYKQYSYLRDKRGKYFNPFSRGPILNLIEFFFCTPDEFDDDYAYDI